jgi:A/G-specific adenine glycosylase
MNALDPDAGAAGFSERLVAWFRVHGRHDLPWQRERTEYRVWLSEIMLQQTQVATVIPYFDRFVSAFPDARSLAQAALDDVLHLWSGLGYYSRARNLHRTARILVDELDGEFPRTLEALTRLPGIGRSTAGAILALAGNQPVAILDGNVKRVLARYHAVEGWAGRAAVLNKLWALSERYVPENDPRDYTQAIMDLGATVCTRAKPDCERCPLGDDCQARRLGRVEAYPAPRPRRDLPQRKICFLVIENGAGQVLLQRRPPSGVWGGLWSFPEAADETELVERAAELGIRDPRVRQRLQTLKHTFTHFRLEIQPLVLDAGGTVDHVADTDDLCWYSGGDSLKIGMAAPVTRLLQTLENEQALRKPDVENG